MSLQPSVSSLSSTNCIPFPLQDLLVRLRILSMVERGKKINMSNMSFTDSSSWWGALGRSLNGEGRRSMMLHINQIVAQAIAAISEYHGTEFCRLIVNHLAQAKIGLQNIATTYKDDPNTIAQISICISNIDLQLERNRPLLDGQQIKAPANK